MCGYDVSRMIREKNEDIRLVSEYDWLYVSSNLMDVNDIIINYGLINMIYFFWHSVYIDC